MIHGDLTGNVLFADPLPPAVIDLALYWRPAAYARAIVVADALAWEGATPDDLAAATSGDGFGQFLARALLARIVTDWLADAHSAPATALPTHRASTLRSASSSLPDLRLCHEDWGRSPRSAATALTSDRAPRSPARGRQSDGLTS